EFVSFLQPDSIFPSEKKRFLAVPENIVRHRFPALFNISHFSEYPLGFFLHESIHRLGGHTERGGNGYASLGRYSYVYIFYVLFNKIVFHTQTAVIYRSEHNITLIEI